MFASPVSTRGIGAAGVAAPYTRSPFGGRHRGLPRGGAGSPFDWGALAFSAGVAAALLVVAALTFRRMEKHFADLV